MNEKEHLKAIISLMGSEGDKRFKSYRLRIVVAILLLASLALAVLLFPDIIGIQIQMFSFVIFFFFGMAVARWDGLNKLKRLMPYFNKAAIKSRLDEIDT